MNEKNRYPQAASEALELSDAIDVPTPADVFDPVIEVYKRDVDRTILRENLKLSPQERSQKFVSFMRSIWKLREAAALSRNA